MDQYTVIFVPHRPKSDVDPTPTRAACPHCGRRHIVPAESAIGEPVDPETGAYLVDDLCSEYEPDRPRPDDEWEPEPSPTRHDWRWCYACGAWRVHSYTDALNPDCRHKTRTWTCPACKTTRDETLEILYGDWDYIHYGLSW